jgi:hypothetical protein
MESAMSAIQVAVASNDALKVIDSVQRFHLCILEKTGNPLLLDTGKRLIVPLLAFTRMRVQARNLDASPWVPEVCRTIREYLMPLEWEIHIWPNRPSFTSRVSFSRQPWPFGCQDNGLDICAEGTRIECGGRMVVQKCSPAILENNPDL